MHQLGGHALFVSPQGSQLGRGEPVEDTARVLSEMVDAVMIRTLDHDKVERFAAAATVPVVNGMTSRCHPCQLLADVQTFEECRGPIAGATVAFVGDGYNMCHSYIRAAGLFGFHLRVATPAAHAPDRALLDASNNVELAATPAAAVADADVVVTDVWASMGHDSQRSARLEAFEGYQVTPQLLDLASRDVLFMHCLPAHRGEEVSARAARRPALRGLARGRQPPAHPEGAARVPARRSGNRRRSLAAIRPAAATYGEPCHQAVDALLPRINSLSTASPAEFHGTANTTCSGGAHGTGWSTSSTPPSTACPQARRRPAAHRWQVPATGL